MRVEKFTSAIRVLGWEDWSHQFERNWVRQHGSQSKPPSISLMENLYEHYIVSRGGTIEDAERGDGYIS